MRFTNAFGSLDNISVRITRLRTSVYHFVAFVGILGTFVDVFKMFKSV